MVIGRRYWACPSILDMRRSLKNLNRGAGSAFVPMSAMLYSVSIFTNFTMFVVINLWHQLQWAWVSLPISPQCCCWLLPLRQPNWSVLCPNRSCWCRLSLHWGGHCQCQLWCWHPPRMFGSKMRRLLQSAIACCHHWFCCQVVQMVHARALHLMVPVEQNRMPIMMNCRCGIRMNGRSRGQEPAEQNGIRMKCHGSCHGSFCRAPCACS